MAPEEFLRRAAEIAGTTGEIAPSIFPFSDRRSGAAQLLRIRTMQQQLRFLKRDVRAVISAAKSSFATARMRVGSGVGTLVASVALGRRAAGRINAARRDDLRRSQLATIEPYQSVIRAIDELIYQLDRCKQQIQLASAYRDSGHSESPLPSVERVETPSPPKSTAELGTADKYFVRIALQVKGPFTRGELEQLFRNGTLQPEDSCCTASDLRWVAAKSLLE